MVDYIRLRIDHIESVPWGFILDDQYKDIPPDLLMHMPKIVYKINGNDHPLTFTFSPNEKRALITGSIRKWYFGPCSINDFTRESFIQAVMKLQEQIGISLLSDNGLTRLTCSEFGVNLLGLNAATLVNAAYQAGNLCRVSRTENEEVRFLGQLKQIMLYDKSLEILCKTQKDIQVKCLRAEIRIKKDLRREVGVNTLLGVYNDWDRISELAYKELSSMKFDIARFCLSNNRQQFKSTCEMLLADFILRNGISEFKRRLAHLPNSRSTRYNQLKTAEKLAKTLVLDNSLVTDYLNGLKEAFDIIHSKGILCLNN